ncbi:MAG: hypothetical protein NXI04_04030 [Planctomycetaceae bacterium]|nr:hypothetical protein [Planctomycetaceae bacterium]
MSNEQFIQSLVQRLNLQLDIPFVGERSEAQMLDWAVRRIVPMIPDSIREFVLSAADGIDLHPLCGVFRQRSSQCQQANAQMQIRNCALPERFDAIRFARTCSERPL